MPIRSGCIRRPPVPVARHYVPPSSVKHKVKDGESWVTLARDLSIRMQASFDPWDLIRFNYPSLPVDKRLAALEVNWYLQEYVGCKKLTPDARNYVFSSSDIGFVYIPDRITASSSPRVPVLDSIKARRDSIMANTPGVFVVADDPTVTPSASPFFSLTAFEEVSLNLPAIEALAGRYHLDANFVAAVVWIETTHGYYDRVNPWNKTIRPMNVHHKLWSQLGLSKESLEKLPINLAAGVHLLSAIWERTHEPTVEKVATLYNELGATRVNSYGKTVAKYMTQKPWLRKK